MRLSFIGNNAQEFGMYWEFITYYNNRAQELVQQEIVESACHLEGLLFGWARDIQNLQNPRFHYNHCLQEYINGLADVNDH